MKKLLSSMKNMDTRVKTAFSLYAFYVLILCVALSLALLTGCKSDSDTQGSPNTGTQTIGGISNVNNLGDTYVAQSIPIPVDENASMPHIVFVGNKLKLHFIVRTWEIDEVTSESKDEIIVYSMNIDGTGFTALPSYIPIRSTHPNIEDITYFTDVASQMLPILSATDSAATDTAGNHYLCATLGEGQNLYVLDRNDDLLFEHSLNSTLKQFVCLNDGSIAFLMWTQKGVDGRQGYILRKIDITAQDVVDILDNIPDSALGVYAGGDDYDVVINTRDNALLGFSFSSEVSPTVILNWTDSGIIAENIRSIAMLSDGRIACVYKEVGKPYELLVLTKADASTLPESGSGGVITIANFGSQEIAQMAAEFNRENAEYTIRVIDYADYDPTTDDYYDGLLRLTTEIITGNAPDILDISYLPYQQYIAKGLLLDLYPFIDNDPQLNRDDFVNGVFQAAETDGKLYHVFPSFGVSTIMGNPSVVGADPSWTMAEFQAVIDAYPGADYPLGVSYESTQLAFLRSVFALRVDEFIDRENSVVHFDTDEFISLLEFSGKLLSEQEYNELLNGSFPNPLDIIASKRQLMELINIYDFGTYYYCFKSMFGEDIIFKGYPTSGAGGNFLFFDFGLAITSTSKQQEGAWQFVRTFLSKDWQTANTRFLPTNRAAFDQSAEDFTRFLEKGEEDRWESDVNNLLRLIASAKGSSNRNVEQDIWNIISESAADYFNGVISAERAAEIIQSRMSILVSERG